MSCINMNWLVFLGCLFLIQINQTWAQKSEPTIERLLINAPDDPESLNLFHVSSEGKFGFKVDYDMMLTYEQMEELYGPGNDDGSSPRARRKAVRDRERLWKEAQVYYEITDSVRAYEGLIKEAIAEWEHYACFQFIETEGQHPWYRVVFKSGKGCSSHVGQQQFTQSITLDNRCMKKGIIMHEIGHAIGFYHEHMRPDRNESIFVNYDVIPKRWHKNFEALSEKVIDTYNIDYDYLSIMHYGSAAIPGSIITRDPYYQDKIGQRERLSFKDIKLAREMYMDMCYYYEMRHDECKRNRRKCPEEGMVMLTNIKGRSCACWCDSGDITDPFILCSDRDNNTKEGSRSSKSVPQIAYLTSDLDPNQESYDVKSPSAESVALAQISETPCFDIRDDCDGLKRRGYCKLKVGLMLDICAKTCDLCDKGAGELCMDRDSSCGIGVTAGWCSDPALQSYMEALCPASCGLCGENVLDPCDIQKELGLSEGSDGRNSGSGAHNGELQMIKSLVLMVTFTLCMA